MQPLKTKHTVNQVYKVSLIDKMEKNEFRLYFIDAIRAWAILMMLQGHFVDGLLDNAYRVDSNVFYTVWKYFRGITAPVFFTVSGFIFTYLLIKGDAFGLSNPRVQKGIKRGLSLLFIGYLLRLNFFGLLKLQIYNSFYLVDVLHCIGLSLLGIIGLYLLTAKRSLYLFAATLISLSVFLFVFEPYYKQFTFNYLPSLLANYFTKSNGSVFTIFPWFGYAGIGAFISVIFNRFKTHRFLYPATISSFIALGLSLIFFSSDLFAFLSQKTGVEIFALIYFNNYLFIRLGDVLLVFAIFMLFRKFMTNPKMLQIGQSTLSIYVVHYVLLYGSFTGLGLYYFLHHTLPPSIVIPGALIFISLTTVLALRYEKNKAQIKAAIAKPSKLISQKARQGIHEESLRFLKAFAIKSKGTLLRLFRLVKN
ncbi:heparan-alpha-glucosaminide N-acetyltransferase domain-containing protein [Arenibacter nanhaiticus]|uniref:heparan-alpha-glucosaminide N-acetyltransferase domain-containing protein n=1 Tax=Arenibacter nanhaiticus TaxID=558155 RepID=UPI002936D5F6|nr:heparan-alpha-glucosaminide N-acetyltransferase domain-containing protein [Arenibacter nanhaiticus]